MKTALLILIPFATLLGWLAFRQCSYRSRKNGTLYYLTRRIQLVGEEKRPVTLYYFQQERGAKRERVRWWPSGCGVTEKLTGLPVLVPRTESKP